ncbi:hypothetical protein F5148DRAFT_1148459 [Russula earlei]|uniref:Uncharacterized protein n=1 Tax=Russula earlei TaxID=71964 RepID=A0ACC0UD69_9AGAM|nr:hypothetical protein F5148DRAFT_1148459 [Russula earlei]
MIWVGVLCDTLISKVAFHSFNDILNLFKEHGISDVNDAYCESVAKSFHGPKLFELILGGDLLEAVIDPVTTALCLPITGLKTLNIEGTMGFYFRVGKDLYTVTAHHILFPGSEGNDSYSYLAGPKKQVVLMDKDTFINFLGSIQGHISTLNITVDILEKLITVLMTMSEGGGPNAEEAACQLVQKQSKLNNT